VSFCWWGALYNLYDNLSGTLSGQEEFEGGMWLEGKVMFKLGIRKCHETKQFGVALIAVADLGVYLSFHVKMGLGAKCKSPTWTFQAEIDDEPKGQNRLTAWDQCGVFAIEVGIVFTAGFHKRAIKIEITIGGRRRCDCPAPSCGWIVAEIKLSFKFNFGPLAKGQAGYIAIQMFIKVTVKFLAMKIPVPKWKVDLMPTKELWKEW